MNGLFAIFLMASTLSAAGEVTAYATLEPPEIPFHRTAEYTITVEYPADVNIDLPELEIEFDGLGIEAEAIEEIAVSEKVRRMKRRYILDPIAITTHAIPGQEIRWGDEERLLLPAATLRVRDLTESEKAQAGIFDEITLPAEAVPEGVSQGWWWAIAVGVVAIGIWLYLRRKQDVPEEVKPLPWDVAYQRLEELGRRNLPESGKFGAYYVDLSAILRYYIEDRFEIHAPEQTTPEFLEDANMRTRLNEGHQDFLANFLRHSDRVKFARYQPSVQEMEEHFVSVKNFVSDTKENINADNRTEVAA